MLGVASGILIVSAVIAAGYLAARLRILGPEVQNALTRTAFYITNPALLYTVVAGSDIRAALGTDASRSRSMPWGRHSTWHGCCWCRSWFLPPST